MARTCDKKATVSFLCSNSAKMVSIGLTRDENRGENSKGGEVFDEKCLV